MVPEHRLSLQLKWHELHMRGDAASLAVCDELQALAAMPYLDMLDESDELLHHRFVRRMSQSGVVTASTKLTNVDAWVLQTTQKLFRMQGHIRVQQPA